MYTICGPVKGILKVGDAELCVKRDGPGYRVVWAQMVREDAGWDEFIVSSSDPKSYPSREEAEAAREKLVAAGESAP